MTPRILALTAFLTIPHLALAQSGKGSWDNLKQQRVGEKIVVVETNFKSTRGAFVAVSEEAIMLETKKGALAISRADVLRVGQHGGGRLRNALAGALAGGLLGLVLVRSTTMPGLARAAIPRTMGNSF